MEKKKCGIDQYYCTLWYFHTLCLYPWSRASAYTLQRHPRWQGCTYSVRSVTISRTTGSSCSKKFNNSFIIFVNRCYTKYITFRYLISYEIYKTLCIIKKSLDMIYTKKSKFLDALSRCMNSTCLENTYSIMLT